MKFWSIFTALLLLYVTIVSTSSKDSKEECEDGKVPTDCASWCPRTCENPFVVCDSKFVRCKPGIKCECPKGLLEHNGQCIDPLECPQRKCTGGMVKTGCASMCPPTCATPRPTICPAACAMNKFCECPDGLLEHDGKCIDISECPKD